MEHFSHKVFHRATARRQIPALQPEVVHSEKLSFVFINLKSRAFAIHRSECAESSAARGAESELSRSAGSLTESAPGGWKKCRQVCADQEPRCSPTVIAEILPALSTTLPRGIFAPCAASAFARGLAQSGVAGHKPGSMASNSDDAATAAPLILASRSSARAEVLRRAGVRFEVVTAGIDEAAAKAAMRIEGASARDVADTLAELKAQRIGARMPGRLVLGADQVLVCNGRLYDKPSDLAEARAQLAALRGRRHELLSAAVMFEAGLPVWRHVGRAELVMRPFSDAFLDEYLAAEGADALATVGAYRLENRGAQLFSQVDGDIFTVMGLPLLPLLDFLRSRSVVTT